MTMSRRMRLATLALLAALAVLLECRREALSEGKQFAVQGMPAGLAGMAGLYGVDALLVAAP